MHWKLHWRQKIAQQAKRLLPGPIERIWSYLTDAEKRGTWLATGEMELQTGGKVEHILRNSELTDHDDSPPPKYANARITLCEPSHLLGYPL